MKKRRPPEPKRAESILEFSRAGEWSAWLTSNHTRSQGVLLRIAKKGAGDAITYAEAVDVALAWGWIDSQKARAGRSRMAAALQPSQSE
jgi:uncharacterized protein YdeI (YjbR/CyaY-like superfamily)